MTTTTTTTTTTTESLTLLAEQAPHGHDGVFDAVARQLLDAGANAVHAGAIAGVVAGMLARTPAVALGELADELADELAERLSVGDVEGALDAADEIGAEHRDAAWKRFRAAF